MIRRDKAKNFNWSSYIKEHDFVNPISEYRRGYQTPYLILKTIRSYLKHEKIKSILELGCSAGHYGKLIESGLGHKLYKAGIDNNETIRNYKFLDRYIVGDMLKFKTKKKFNVVFSLGLIEHYDRTLRRKIFLKHLELSDNFVIIGFPNVDFSITYLQIKIYNDLIRGNRHFRVGREELLSLAKSQNLKIQFEGYFGNTYLLQRFFRLKKSFSKRFFLDYYLIILQKKGKFSE